MFSYCLSFYFCVLYSVCILLVSTSASDGPLIVTKYLDGPQADVEAAVRLAEVSPDIVKGVKSYSGYFNVNKSCGNNLFFWFFPADMDWVTMPVVLWLKGAPGSNIMSGVFEEVGPIQFLTGRLVKMANSWTLKFNVLFIDQPAGSGFSFTENECYPKSINSAMHDTFIAIKQFFVMFHQLSVNPFYITGDYFMSHYGPSLARLILENNEQLDKSNKINLQGVLIMNGKTNIECHDFSNVLYQLGIADQKKQDEFKNIHYQIVKKVYENKFYEASVLENEIFKKLKEDTKLPSIYNFAANEELSTNFINFINENNIKKQLHVGNRTFISFNEKVKTALLPAYFSTPKEGIEYIVGRNYIFIGYIHGQMEVINPYSAVNCFLKTIQWPVDEDFTKAHRNILKMDDKVIGWIKVVGNFFHILVRKAGRYMGVDLGKTSLVIVETTLEPIQTNTMFN